MQPREVIITWIHEGGLERHGIIVTLISTMAPDGSNSVQWQMGIAGHDMAHVIDAGTAAALVGGRQPDRTEVL